MYVSLEVMIDEILKGLHNQIFHAWELRIDNQAQTNISYCRKEVLGFFFMFVVFVVHIEVSRHSFNSL
jgi:hypothetical protein